MGDVSEHFSRSEFACKDDCGFDVVDIELVTILEAVRQHFQAAVKINSACRCAKHNAAMGGSPKSQHLLGKAADIVVSGVHPDEVHDYLNSLYPYNYGLGRYKTFTHFDVRDIKSRWDKSGD